MALLGLTGPEECPLEDAVLLLSGGKSSVERQVVGEVVDWAMSGVGPGLNLVNLRGAARREWSRS